MTWQKKLNLLFLTLAAALTGCNEGNFETDDRLAAEKAVLEEQKQIVENIKKQIENEQRRSDNAIPIQIENQQTQIGTLGVIISQVREAQSDISTSGSEALSRENLQAQQIQNQVLPQIQSLQQSIPRLEEQITLLTSIGLRSKEQEGRLTELKSQLAEQKILLDNLQSQLTALNVESITRSNQIYRTMLDQRRELASYKEDVQTELDTRREALSSLQTYSLQSRMSLMTLNQQLRNAEQALNAQTKKVRAMENQNK
ncbi:MAG: hypothetical protein K0R29_1165 [Pseudobdellovibrio sp.]|jgi:chromosome segregation ATPase|nr:hypothetical protein [Pseudobdellovibrio sp.]